MQNLRRQSSILALSALAFACDGLKVAPDSNTGPDLQLDAGAGIVVTAGAGSGGAQTVGGGVAGTTASAGAVSAGGAGGTAGTPGVPREVPYRAIAISSSILHTCVLLDDQQVKCFGNNFMGQLGTGDTETRAYCDGLANEPVLDLGAGRSVLALSSGRYTTCALLDDHSVKCWGFGTQNGHPEGVPLGDGPGEMGDALPTVDLGPGRTAVQLALGYDVSFALLDDGNVRRWTGGEAPTTQTVQEQIVQLVGVMGSAVARYADGSVGILGDVARVPMGQATAVSLFSDAMFMTCAKLDNGNTVCSRGGGSWDSWQFHPRAEQVGLLTLSDAYCFITELGAARCNFELPPYVQGMPNLAEWWRPGTLDPQHTAEVRLYGSVAALSSGGSGYMCALMTDGSVKCWGDNPEAACMDSGNGPIPALDLGTRWVLDPPQWPLGDLPNDPTEYPPFCGDGSLSIAEECDDSNPFSGDECTNECRFAVCGDSSVWAGHEVNDPGVQIVNDGCEVACNDPHSGYAPMVLMTAGDDFNCVLKSSGAVHCWGDNESGALGICTTENIGDEPFEMGVAAPWVSLDPTANATFLMTGDHHSCAVLDSPDLESRVLKCWGDNEYGQLGLGDVLPRGDVGDTMGLDLPAVDSGGAGLVSMVSGGSSNCVYTTEGEILCWGGNLSGQLGLGDTNSRGDEPGEMGASLAPPDMGTGYYANQVVLGRAHACAVLNTSDVKCWGDNSHGQLGLGDTENRGDEPFEMGDNLPVVDYGSVDVGHPPQLYARGDFTCVVLAGGLKCWGDNSQGQLGQGDTNNRGDEPGEMGDNLEFIDLGFGEAILDGVSLGPTHACATAVTHTGSQLKCWGSNSHAQLGLGDLENRGDEALEMGEALPWVDIGIGRQDLRLVLGSQHSCADSSAGVQCWGANDRGQLAQEQFGADRLIVGDSSSEMGDALPNSNY